jgi:hypothetical protein
MIEVLVIKQFAILTWVHAPIAQMITNVNLPIQDKTLCVEAKNNLMISTKSADNVGAMTIR